MPAYSDSHFNDDTAAREFLERVLWPQGPVCPHCGTVDHAYPTKKAGVYRCAEKGCRKDFTVTKGTVMERSHIPLHKWVLGFHLMTASKKGFSAHQLHRTLGISYKAAWFMEHRIRECMRAGGLDPLGGGGKAVEADETYFGPVETPRPRSRGRIPKPTKRGRSGPADKRPIVSLVERGGRVRSFYPGVADKVTVTQIVRDNIDHESTLHTDESRLYHGFGEHFAGHETVKHSAGEYVRYKGGEAIHTNTVEGYFSIFKRGMRGVYQHCREKHLHRYLAEFDFRYNHRTALGVDDAARAIAAVKGAEGERLTYRQPHSANV